MQRQPARALKRLLETPGETVSRHELQQLLWGDRHVDAEQSINDCIRQVRRALGESATEPAFIETVRGEGYRWLLPLSPAQPRISRRILSATVAVMLGLSMTWLVLRPDTTARAAACHSSRTTLVVKVSDWPLDQQTFGIMATDIHQGVIEDLLSDMSWLRVERHAPEEHSEPTTNPRSYELAWSLAAVGETIRLAATLVASSENRILWSSSWDLRSNNPASVREDIVSTVVSAIDQQVKRTAEPSSTAAADTEAAA